ncbi:SDR family oxidoreductase [Paenibacillus thermoaerophilus]|uniref:SDR family oxidoreductase n=1 Tax=Paenibacillus thermoaerophilus TaxID=1215385 RepID=A0ABW2V3D4_9BACL|nr:SDR family oxidoreductase [Paenibacillus thermoaerophilus]TMV11975.1 SDR family oxidoreductase [Paenibacillus thermoaerophilus]
MAVACVSGGAQGIGRAIALAFARAGYGVSIADPDRQAGLETIQWIRAEGGDAMYVNADVSSPDDVAKWMRLTEAELGPPDALVNNAGIGHTVPFLELKPEDFDRVLAVNLRGTMLCSQAAARLMAAKGSGSIVNIASTRALMSEPDSESYAASKGGIVSLTHAMAVSLGRYGIRVNCISPGWIETRDWQYSERAETPVHSERDRLQHPVGRVGRPDDIAEACLFMCRSAGFVTGQNWVIDGGMTIKMIYE